MAIASNAFLRPDQIQTYFSVVNDAAALWLYMRDGLHLSGKVAGVVADGLTQELWQHTLFKLVGQWYWQSKLKVDKMIAVPI